LAWVAIIVWAAIIMGAEHGQTFPAAVIRSMHILGEDEMYVTDKYAPQPGGLTQVIVKQPPFFSILIRLAQSSATKIIARKAYSEFAVLPRAPFCGGYNLLA